ncbi:MAG: hypothetical protein ACJAZ9_001780 [Neolewinella sp.]|jgi:hypothetical protein
MSEEVKKSGPSSFMVLIYIILAITLLTLFLEVTGMADVAGTRENQEIINNPH